MDVDGIDVRIWRDGGREPVLDLDARLVVVSWRWIVDLGGRNAGVSNVGKTRWARMHFRKVVRMLR